MQLNMITPMDIGLERQDGVDDSDMFDLGEVEGGVERKGVKGGLGSDVDSGVSDDDLDEIEEEDEDELDSDVDEEERKTQRLERSLDALYDQFHQHKIERDAKHKAKEERRKRDAVEGGEWGGIKAPGSDDESEEEDDDPAPMPSDSDDSDDDGPDRVEVADGMNVDGEEEDDVEEDDEVQVVAKPVLSKRAIKAAALADSKKRARDGKLITNLAKPISDEKRVSDKKRAAAQWFDQPVFKGLAGLDEMMRGEAPEEEDVLEEEGEEGVSGVWEEMDEEDAEAEAKALAVRTFSSRGAGARADVGCRSTRTRRTTPSRTTTLRERSRVMSRIPIWRRRRTSRRRRTPRN